MIRSTSTDLFCRSLLALVPLTVFSCKPSCENSEVARSTLPDEIESALFTTFSPWQVWSEYLGSITPRLPEYPVISSLFYARPHSPYFRSLLLSPELPDFVFSYVCPLCRESSLYVAYAQHGSYRDSLSRILCVSCKNRLWPYL